MWIFLGGHFEIGLFFVFFFFFGGGGGSFLYTLGIFKVNTQNGNILWAAIFQIFLGMPDIPVFFFFFFFFLGGGGGRWWDWVNSRCWFQAYVCRKLRVPPGLSFGTDLYFTLALYGGLGMKMFQMTI